MQPSAEQPPKLANALREGFIWATGIEDTFIATPHPETGRVLDEYLLTEHYERWREDLDLVAELGVPYARYGIPWHRVNPARGVFDWSWTDQVLDYMVRKLGIEPIVDLVHYGTPLWLEESFFNPHYPEIVSEYARAFAEHYKGLCYWYTPLNEPRINAWYSGRISRWPPYGSGWKGFTRVLLQVARGICLTQQALLETEPEAVMVHVDASDLYFTRSEDPEIRAEVDLRQQIVYLALEFVLGRVDQAHPLRAWLRSQGVGDSELRWFDAHKLVPHVIGFNMYPIFSLKEILRDKQGRLDIRMRPCGVETLVRIARGYAERFPGFPLMVTETADKGSVNRRCEWIQRSTDALLAERERGLPLIGYTFWPLFSLFTWAYHSGTAEADEYLLHIGLWDLERGPSGLERKRTRAADCFRSIVAGSGGSGRPAGDGGGRPAEACP